MTGSRATARGPPRLWRLLEDRFVALRNWRSRWRAWRDRLLTDPRFRSAALGFPVGRTIGRRRARRLFDICAGFVYTQVLAACVRLDLFDRLAIEPRSPEDLAGELGLTAAATRRLLRAAESLELLEERDGGRYGLGRLGAPLVDDPGLVALIRHNAAFYDDLRDPVALLRDEMGDAGLRKYWAYVEAERPDELAESEVAGYTRLMSLSQAAVAEQVITAYDFGRHRCLLDVGGGDGSFVAAVAAACPDLRVRVFDLPPVAATANREFLRRGLGKRAEALAGNFLRDPLPEASDVVTLVRVVHDCDDDEALALLKKIRGILPDGGALLIAEQLAGTRGARPAADAYLSFYLLSMGRGRPRTRTEISRLLCAAGFKPPRELRSRLPMQARILVAIAKS